MIDHNYWSNNCTPHRNLFVSQPNSIGIQNRKQIVVMSTLLRITETRLWFRRHRAKENEDWKGGNKLTSSGNTVEDWLNEEEYGTFNCFIRETRRVNWPTLDSSCLSLTPHFPSSVDKIKSEMPTSGREGQEIVKKRRIFVVRWKRYYFTGTPAIQ